MALWRRKRPSVDKPSPLDNPLRGIEFQQPHRYPAGGCQWNNDRISQLEVIAPTIPPGMEKHADLVGLPVNRCKVAAFVLVADDAAQSQIRFDRLPTMFDRDDMINLMGLKA